MKQVKDFFPCLLGSTQPVYCEFLIKQKSESEIGLTNVTEKLFEFFDLPGDFHVQYPRKPLQCQGTRVWPAFPHCLIPPFV